MRILITGVSSGIGHRLAATWLSEGHDVWGISRQRPADLCAQGMRFISVDLSDAAARLSLLQPWLHRETPWETVVLNAGVLGPLELSRQHAVKTYAEVMEINVWAQHWLMQTILDTHSGVQQFVAISSGAGLHAKPRLGPYCVSKAALNMLMQVYAVENPDIHFTSLMPGVVDTPMQQSLQAYVASEQMNAGHGPPLLVRPLTPRDSLSQVAQRLARVIPELRRRVTSGTVAHLDALDPPPSTA